MYTQKKKIHLVHEYSNIKVEGDFHFVEFTWPDLRLIGCGLSFAKKIGFASIDGLKTNSTSLFNLKQKQELQELCTQRRDRVQLSVRSKLGGVMSFDVTLGRRTDGSIQLFFYDISKSQKINSTDRLIAMSNIGIARIRLKDFKLISSNECMAKLLGFESSHAMLDKNALGSRRQRITMFPGYQVFFEKLNKDRKVIDHLVEMELEGTSSRFLSFNAELIVDGFVDVLCVDKSELMNTKVALSSAEDRLNAIADEVSALVYQCRILKDGNIKFTYVSKGVERFLEASEDEVLNDCKLFYNRIHIDDLRAVREFFLQFKKDYHGPTIEYRLVKSDDSIIWCRGHLYTSLLASGETLLNGVVLDITREKESKEFKRGIEHELVHAKKLGL